MRLQKKISQPACYEPGKPTPTPPLPKIYGKPTSTPRLLKIYKAEYMSSGTVPAKTR